MNNKTKQFVKAVIQDEVFMADLFHQMNIVINLGNDETTDFWSVEQKYTGIEKLFLLLPENTPDENADYWYSVCANKDLSREERAETIYQSFKCLIKKG